MFIELLNSVLGVVILVTIFQDLGTTLILISMQICINIIFMCGISFKKVVDILETFPLLMGDNDEN